MLAVILGSTLFAQDAADAVDEALLAKLQGEWRYAGMTANGKPQNRDWEDEDVSTFSRGRARGRSWPSGRGRPEKPRPIRRIGR